MNAHLVLVGPYRAAKIEAAHRGLDPFEWRYAGRLPQVYGLPRGLRYVLVGDPAERGRYTSVLDYLHALDATEEARVTE